MMACRIYSVDIYLLRKLLSQTNSSIVVACSHNIQIQVLSHNIMGHNILGYILMLTPLCLVVEW